MERMYPIPVLRNKNRCPYVSIHLDCNVGGPATAECFHPHFHNACDYKKKAQERHTAANKP